LINNVPFNDLIPPLRRPEYAPSPETFLTSVAWSLFDLPSISASESVLYRRKEKEASSGAGNHRYTHSELLEKKVELKKVLSASGIKVDGNGGRIDSDFIEALLNGLSGTASVSSSYVSAVPIVPATALLQTVRGMKGKANDTKFAGMLEDLYVLGSGEAIQSGSFAEMWLNSAESRLINYPLLGAIDSALDSVFGPRTRKTLVVEPQIGWTLLNSIPDLKARSPFAWFSDAWSNLNSSDWVSALPPRVWTDWAASVSRTGFGMSYLWEAAWFNRVSMLILDDSADASDLQNLTVGDLLQWFPETATQELRDCGRQIGRPIRRGGELRQVLQDFIESSNGERIDVIEGLERAKADTNLKKRLSEIRQKPKGGKAFKDTVEAVSYSLQTRSGLGANADFYGVLRSQGKRGSWEVAPGTEWLASIVSLTAKKPGVGLNLGLVMNQLSRIGISVNTPQVVSLLERAGLARGSDDADLGLFVQTAFDQRNG
jgi:hypothetical protein